MGCRRRAVTLSLAAMFAGAGMFAGAPALAQTPPAQTPSPSPAQAPQAGPSQSLTITPQARERRAPALSEQDRRALDLFSAQPTLTPSRGLSIGPAFGPHDEDCVRAGGEVFCRQ